MVETNLARKRSHFVATTPTSLARVFHNLRIHRGVTAKELSKKLGVGEVYISQIECGFKKPSLKYWLAYGQEFGFNANWIKVKWLNEKSNYARERLREKIGLTRLEEV